MRNSLRKTLAGLCVLCMLVACMPLAALAGTAEDGPETSLLLETAVELARRQAHITPGIVVPQVYQQSVQFLLPLCLRDMEQPDLAMTLRPMDGYYMGYTCLTLQMAYTNARLLARPTAPWLLALVE